MANDSGGNGFMGLIAGLLIAVLLIAGGLFLFNSGGLHRGTNINVEVPTPQAPG